PTGHFLSGLFKAIGHFFSNIWHAITGALKSLLKNSIIRSLIQLAACAFGGPIGCIAAAPALTLAAGGSISQALQAFAFTALSVGVWTGVGQFLRAEGLAGNILGKSLIHGIVGGALSVAHGGSFLQGFATSAVGAGAGLFSSGISGNDPFLDSAI